MAVHQAVEGFWANNGNGPDEVRGFSRNVCIRCLRLCGGVEMRRFTLAELAHLADEGRTPECGGVFLNVLQKTNSEVRQLR